jgi:hypothetical protein
MKRLIQIARLVGVGLYIFAALDVMMPVFGVGFNPSLLLQIIGFLIFGYIFFTFIPSHIILRYPKNESDRFKPKNTPLGVGFVVASALVVEGGSYFISIYIGSLSQLGPAGGVLFLLNSPVLILFIILVLVLFVILLWKALKNL